MGAGTEGLVRYRLWASVICSLLIFDGARAGEEESAPRGWTTKSPRKQIRPDFSYEPEGGPKKRGSFVIEADQRRGLFGWWEKSFPVEGGRHYNFFALLKTSGIRIPRRAAVARVRWRNDEGNSVLRAEPTDASYRPGTRPRVEPEFPARQGVNDAGWTEVSGTYIAPPEATVAVVELSYRWAPAGRVEWACVSFD